MVCPGVEGDLWTGCPIDRGLLVDREVNAAPSAVWKVALTEDAESEDNNLD